MIKEHIIILKKFQIQILQIILFFLTVQWRTCFKLGINLNPDVRRLPQDKIQFQYDAEEKYRNYSIEQVKEKRKNN